MSHGLISSFYCVPLNLILSIDYSHEILSILLLKAGTKMLSATINFEMLSLLRVILSVYHYVSGLPYVVPRK